MVYVKPIYPTYLNPQNRHPQSLLRKRKRVKDEVEVAKPLRELPASTVRGRMINILV